MRKLEVFKENRMTDNDYSHLLQLIDELSIGLDYKLNLSKSERQRLLRVGDAHKVFIERAAYFAKEYPALIPEAISGEELEHLYIFNKKTEDLNRQLRPLLKSLEDTHAYVNSCMLKNAYIIYNTFKAMDGLAYDGVEEAVKELKQLFKRVKAKEGNTEPIEENIIAKEDPIEEEE